MFLLKNIYTDSTELFLTQTRILNLTTLGLLTVISGFNALGAPAIQSQVAIDKTASSISDALTSKDLTTEEKVTEYFADNTILIDIARCESRFRQTDKNGNVLRGEVTPADVGVMQINEKYHLSDSKKLGYDIYTLEGNMAYARYLYEKEGARPWLASSHCWASYQAIAKK